MNKILLVAGFFMLLLSTEIFMAILAIESYEISVKELKADGESEKDAKEKSEEKNKVEIQLGINSDHEDNLYKLSSYSKEAFLNQPYLDLATPPPKL